MNRRQFLQQIAFAATASVIGSQARASHGRVVSSPVVASRAAASPNRLIVVFLRGAVDGLSVLIPYQEAAYYQVRPTIAIPRPGAADGALNLDGYFGLHPALAGLMPLWQQGSLAFVQACGSPAETRSHFDAQRNMESGTPGRKATVDGWMNRLLTVLATDSPMGAVTDGATIPTILRGQAKVANLWLGNGATNPVALDRERLRMAFDQLYQQEDALSQAYRIGLDARRVQLQALTGGEGAVSDHRMQPGTANDFVQTTQQLARLMVKEPQIQLAFLGVDGWDTHLDQGGSRGLLATNLQNLGTGLAALVQGLGPVYRHTAILVMSEFGRTVRENGNGGTDHGHGNVLWLLGGNIRGGKVYGDWHGLEEGQLHEGRDLPVTIDFRDPITTLLQQHLQIESAQLQQIFPEYTPRHQLEVI
jgi:uncharacterized protein (DUF1501 family)